MSSISTTLGAGSGVDFTALASQLVDAQFAAKNAALTKKNTQLTTQISGLGQLKSGIMGFSSGLSTLVKGGSLATQPTSSNTTILNVSALAGAKLSGFSASLEVRALAAAQSAATTPVTDRTASIGTGKFTLTFGTGTVASGAFTGFVAGSGTPVDIPIDAAHASLDGIASAINAANAGITATIVTDAAGARLTLKGKSGAEQAFTLSATEDSGAPGLAALNIGPGATGTTIGTAAADAVVAVDGVSLKRSTNSISDLLPGVQLDLVNAAVGTVVTIGTKAPGAQISQAVSDFVETFNQLQSLVKSQTNATTGSLFGDPAARTLGRSLGQLTLTQLVSGAAAGAPKTLSDIGISTNRDGTLSVNAAQLAKALAANPAGVEALFADGSGASGGGLAAALAAISTSVTDATSGLGASAERYGKQQSQISVDQSKISTQEEALRTRLTKQFAGADARIAAYKATQDYLKQQVDSWNAAKN